VIHLTLSLCSHTLDTHEAPEVPGEKKKHRKRGGEPIHLFLLHISYLSVLIQIRTDLLLARKFPTPPPPSCFAMASEEAAKSPPLPPYPEVLHRILGHGVSPGVFVSCFDGDLFSLECR
jgi:hypothetical protein